MHRHPRGSLVDLTDFIEVFEIQIRMQSLSVHVQGHRHKVEVSGAFPISEEGTLNPVRSRKQAKLGGGGAGPTVIVRMQTDHRLAALPHIPAEPFDLIGMHVGGEQFDGGGKIQNDRILFGRFPDLHHRLAHLQGVVHLGVRKALRGILQLHLGVG